jgi:hypothetical protein
MFYVGEIWKLGLNIDFLSYWAMKSLNLVFHNIAFSRELVSCPNFSLSRKCEYIFMASFHLLNCTLKVRLKQFYKWVLFFHNLDNVWFFFFFLPFYLQAVHYSPIPNDAWEDFLHLVLFLHFLVNISHQLRMSIRAWTASMEESGKWSFDFYSLGFYLLISCWCIEIQTMAFINLHLKYGILGL